MPQFVRYVIWRDDRFELVATEDAFSRVFTPITTSAEALSYALVMQHKLSGRYNLAYDPEYTYFVDVIEDTYVEEIPGGYLVHLFASDTFECGPRLTEAVTVEVTVDGLVKELDRVKIYEAPPDDELCMEEH